MTNALSLQKLSPTLTGGEKARLILKDFHEKTHGNRIGFLTDADLTVLRIKDSQEQDEFSRLFKMYESVPDVMTCFQKLSISFMSLYQELGELHYRLRLSKALHVARRIVAGTARNITDEASYSKRKEDNPPYLLVIKTDEDDPLIKAMLGGLKESLESVVWLLDEIQPIRGKSVLMTTEVAFNDNLDYAKAIISQLHQYSSDILTLAQIAGEMEQALGIDTFSIREHGVTYQTVADNTMRCVKRHNDIVLNSFPHDEVKELTELMYRGNKEIHYKEPRNLKEYLIPDPIANETLCNEWHKKIFW